MLKNRYDVKMRKLQISKEFLWREEGEKTTVKQLVKYSNTDSEVKINVLGLLYNATEHEPYDFSYLLGLQLGIFNVYQPEDLSLYTKRKFSSIHFEKEDTYHMITRNGKAIANYLSEKHQVKEKVIYKTMRQMLQLQDENSNYDNAIALDIGKMITAYYLYFGNKSLRKNTSIVNGFFESGQAMYYFDQCNYIVEKRKK